MARRTRAAYDRIRDCHEPLRFPMQDVESILGPSPCPDIGAAPSNAHAYRCGCALRSPTFSPGAKRLGCVSTFAFLSAPKPAATSLACIAGKRFHPGTTAARLISFHLG